MINRRHYLQTGAAVLGASVLAGCLSSTAEDGEFALERVVLSSEDPDRHDSYEDVPDKRVFRIDEPFWVLVVAEYVPTDDDGTASLDYTFQIERPDGSSWDPVRERHEEWENVEPTELLIVWEKFSTFPEDEPGEYEMRITVKDRIESHRLRTDESFTLEGGEQ